MVKYILMDYSAYGGDTVWGIHSTRADVEEAFLDLCEDIVYECMMTSDPADVFGDDEWDWKHDYEWLMRDCARTLIIVEAPYYD